MKIGIASDHRGYEKKEKIKKYLNKKGVEVEDFGTDSTKICDFPDFAYPLCDAVLKEDVNYGILICGTGIGMSIAANKKKGIYCAKVDTAKEAKLCKEHNHANVIAISSSKFMFEIKDMIDSFLKAQNFNSERYVRRIDKIKAVESKRKK